MKDRLVSRSTRRREERKRDEFTDHCIQIVVAVDFRRLLGELLIERIGNVMRRISAEDQHCFSHFGQE
jgi:hypothetical protein